jgi:uncharacterized protein YutD
METVDLVKAVVNSEHGWAVAEQFEDTFNGESFEEQNTNALDYIRDCLKYDVMRSSVFNDDAMRLIKVYYDELVEYLEEAK